MLLSYTNHRKVKAVQKPHTFKLLSFNDATKVHFLALQGERELAVHEYEGSFYFTIASGSIDAPDFVEEECTSLQQAYAHLVRNLDVPL